MTQQNYNEEIRGYCSACVCWCPTKALIKDGIFVKVKPDDEHPLSCPLCPKGLAGPELVYSKERLKYPMQRTRPKGDPDPGWKRISWDEALDTIASNLNKIKANYGPESVAFARSGPGGSPMGELDPWVFRIANAFGSPNAIATTHICQWHRDGGSLYTYGGQGGRGAFGRAEFERSGCILIWGNNVHATRKSLVPLIERGKKKGAKLIVIDPRHIKMAEMADLWLQVLPGTDGALALGMINVMIEEGLYDYDFVRDWTTAPFLIRSDTGGFLKGSDLFVNGDPSDYVLMDVDNRRPRLLSPGAETHADHALDALSTVRLLDGTRIEVKTVFHLLKERTSKYQLTEVSKITGISKKKIQEAAHMLAKNRPASWYSWNGIEQSTNATQTNRAICILYALTGDYDTPGGNVIIPGFAANSVHGHHFLNPELENKRLGLAERPLGPCGTAKSIQAYEVYESILTGAPYPIKAMVGFGGNILLSNAPSNLGKEALSRLDFHVQAELFMSPTAELADIVLPAASFWESRHVGVHFHHIGDKAQVELRPVVVPPQNESWPDLKIIFELAKRLGCGNMFWDGDIEAGFNHQLAPSNINVEQLRRHPGGITINLPMEYRKYSNKDGTGKYMGFFTPSKRIELYSSVFRENGQDPLPAWKDLNQTCGLESGKNKDYPFMFISSKVIEYSHSQHRAIPSLRKRVPHPCLEMNSKNARELEIRDGDPVIVETAFGSITLRAKLTDGIPYQVVSTQNGWWQGCPELNLPDYDPFSSEGANINLLFDTNEKDPISGSLPLKGYPCNVIRHEKDRL